MQSSQYDLTMKSVKPFIIFNRVYQRKTLIVVAIIFSLIFGKCVFFFDSAVNESSPRLLWKSAYERVNCMTFPKLVENGNSPHLEADFNVHFIFGFEKRARFSFINYLAIQSALKLLSPQKVYLYGKWKPKGVYWELVQSSVIFRYTEPKTSIFGNNIIHYAHAADVLRLEVLLKYGGIYLDIDVVTLRPFHHLLQHDAVMAEEQGQGVCNAVIVARKNSSFIYKWYQMYKNFSSSNWNHHSVLLPKSLAALYPDEIKVLDNKAFFYPLWDHAGRKEIYSGSTYDYKGNYGLHMWNTVSKDNLNNFTVGWTSECKSRFFALTEPYVPIMFSVVMQCYNQWIHVKDTVYSVFGQEFKFWELIIVDDNSPDNCGQKVLSMIDVLDVGLELKKKVRVIVNNMTLGLAQSRNNGIRTAKGIFICALDADDFIDPFYLRQADMYINKYPEVELLYANQVANEKSAIFERKNLKTWELDRVNWTQALRAGPLPVLYLYRRSLIDDLGGYRGIIPFGQEDYDLWLRLLDLDAKRVKMVDTNSDFRYKEKSLIRDSQKFINYQFALLHTMHPTLYHFTELLKEHSYFESMPTSFLQDMDRSLQVRFESSESLSIVCYWLALVHLKQEDFSRAIHYASMIDKVNFEHPVQALKWQPLYLGIQMHCLVELNGNLHELSKHLLREFGSQQSLEETLQRFFPEINRLRSVSWHHKQCMYVNPNFDE